MRGSALGTLVDDLQTPLTTTSIQTLAAQIQARELALADAIRRVEIGASIGILGACVALIALFTLARR